MSSVVVEVRFPQRFIPEYKARVICLITPCCFGDMVLTTAHVTALAATCSLYSFSQAGALVQHSHAGAFRAQPSPPTGDFSSLGARARTGRGMISSTVATSCSSPSRFPRTTLRQQQHHHHQCRRSRPSHVRLGALPEDSGGESTTADETIESGRAETERSADDAGSGRNNRRAGSGGGGSGGAGKGTLDGQFISKLAKRLAGSFPLLTTDEIKKEVRALLNPETKGDTPAKV